MEQLPQYLLSPDPEIYLRGSWCCADYETTNIEKGNAANEENRLLLIRWCTRDGDSGTVDLETPEGPTGVAEYFKALDRTTFFIAQNAKFELKWLKRLGYPIHKMLIFDTMLAEKVRAGNRAWRFDLGSISKRYGMEGKDPYVDLCMKSGICPSELPRCLLVDRVIDDVEKTVALFKKQLQKLREAKLFPVFFTRCLLTPVLADIEFNGMCADEQRVTESFRENTAKAQELLEQLEHFSGDINLNSPIQRAEYLYDTLGFSEPRNSRGDPIRTDEGGRKTDADTLAALVARTDKQRRFLDLYRRYNKVKTLLSKNLDFFYGVVRERGGVFRAQFNQTTTSTHRLSSSGIPLVFKMFTNAAGKSKARSVQFQNMPRALKRLFKARRKGWKIGEADGAQLEFRVAAHQGRDKKATESIRDKFDVHTFTACQLNDIPEEEFDRHGKHASLRTNAKPDTFKPLYGGKSGTEAQKRYYAAFRERYPGITDWQKENVETVLKKKKLRINSGLIFYWPDTKRDRKSGYVHNTPSICNYPVQSYATADIIPIALIYLWHAIKALDLQSFIVNTVHDSIISEIHPEEEEIYRTLVNEAFTRYTYYYLGRVYNDPFTVPLAAGWKCSKYWSEGEELEHVEEPPIDMDYTQPYIPLRDSLLRRSEV